MSPCKKISYISLLIGLLFQRNPLLNAQENTLTHYFSASSYDNPASAGDTRFIQVGFINRIQPLTSTSPVYNTLLTYDQKLRNHRSGIGFTINQKVSGFKELQIKLNYSHSWTIFTHFGMKGGLGFSWNFLNSHASSYFYPDQYDRFGITGEPTHEWKLEEYENYPAFAAGMIMYNEFGWLSVAGDYLNRPRQEFAGKHTNVPISWSIHGGYLFQLDKYQRPRRIINPKGGLEPYSSIGPVAGFHKQGPFYSYNFGINAFLHPVFAGISYRKFNFSGENILQGVSSLNLLLGYRNEKLSVAYSYDAMISRTATNYQGAHEISVIIYLYTIREDYRKNTLIPFPNQLMY